MDTTYHLPATLTGGAVPAHVPGAYPRLSCCGGAVILVPASTDGRTDTLEGSPMRVSSISDTLRSVSYGPTLGDMFALVARAGVTELDSWGVPQPLPAVAWPGAYPLAYYDESGDILCHVCAESTLDSIAECQEGVAIACDVIWEGPAESCAECGAVMDTAYGDPDAQD